MHRVASSPTARPRLRALGLAALGLAATVRFAAARVADTDLAHLTATADVIVLGTDRAVEDVDGKKVARFAVERVLLGPHATSEVSYLAEGSWTCDTAHAVPGERALLFLRRLPDRSPPLHAVHWAGRGRMPIREHDARAWATVWTSNVRLPPDLPIASGPDPGTSFIQDVALDPLIDAIVVALWKHRAWRAAEVAAAALAVLAFVRLAPWFVRQVRADLEQARAQPPLARRARLAQVMWRTLLGAAAVFAMWIAIGFTWAGRAERAADAEWARVHQSSAALRSRFPETFPNSTALALDRLALRFGVEILPFEQAPWPQPSRREPRPGLTGQPPAWSAALTKTLRDPSGAIEPQPPEALASFAEHDADVQTLMTVALGAQPPTWGFHLDSPIYSTTIDTFGLADLVRELLARALELWRTERRAEALAALDAAWPLVASTWSSPNEIGELAEIRLLPALATTLRKIDASPSVWEPRLAAIQPRDHGISAIQTQTLERISHFRDLPIGPSSRTPVEDALAELATADPHIEFLAFASGMRIEGADLYRRAALRAEVLYAEPRCERGRDVPAALIEPHLYPWDWLVPGPATDGLLRDLAPYWLDITELHVDLTRRVLAARAHRARTGAWPNLGEPETDTICPGRRWVYESRPDGSLAISLDPPLRASTVNGADRFPLAIELGSAA